MSCVAADHCIQSLFGHGVINLTEYVATTFVDPNEFDIDRITKLHEELDN